MNGSLKYLVGSLAAALSLAVNAQQGPGMVVATAPAKAAPAGACAKARDPQRCEALQIAKETCKDKSAADKRKCMADAMPPMDCSKSRSPARCEAHQKAKAACKDKNGPEYRQCLREQTQAAGKSQPSTPKK